MPSYDKAKLRTLLEQRHGANLHRRDLSTRASEANLERNRLAAILRHRDDGRRSQFVEDLLKLPTPEALKLSADDIQGYARKTGNLETRVSTGINYSTYRKYIAERERAKHLQAQMDTANREFEERFGFVERLREAVMNWGFSDPMREI